MRLRWSSRCRSEDWKEITHFDTKKDDLYGTKLIFDNVFHVFGEHREESFVERALEERAQSK